LKGTTNPQWIRSKKVKLLDWKNRIVDFKPELLFGCQE
jgi:hypothetical protein